MVVLFHVPCPPFSVAPLHQFIEWKVAHHTVGSDSSQVEVDLPTIRNPGGEGERGEGREQHVLETFTKLEKLEACHNSNACSLLRQHLTMMSDFVDFCAYST